MGGSALAEIASPGGGLDVVQMPANAIGAKSPRKCTYGCFGARAPCHSYQPAAGTRQRRPRAALPNADDVNTVSARALIHWRFAQCGLNPQTNSSAARLPSRRVRITAASWLGATLNDRR